MDKIVLDVGCGTGILSMFAAKAGAKLVIGVDMSNIIDQTRHIVKANGLDSIITLLKGRMEDVVLPKGVQKVDVIISEWMTSCLLHDAMLKTVLFARDKYLIPGGLLLPDKATLYVAAIEQSAEKEGRIRFWENVYGFDMTHIKRVILKEPMVDQVVKEAVISTSCPFYQIDLNTATLNDLQFDKVPFQVSITKNDILHGFVCYFDISFNLNPPLVLTTSPLKTPTHWKQTIFYLPEDFAVSKDQVIRGTFSLVPNLVNDNDCDICIKYVLDGKTIGTRYKMSAF